jgi:hypothetical protein
MGITRSIAAAFLLVYATISAAQPVIKKSKFFDDDELINMDLSTDLKKITSEKKLNSYQPATITFRFADSSKITEDVTLTARGEFRRNNCFIPTMRINFDNPGSPKLRPLKKLKLVCGCGFGAENERLILKEYLVYKMYNMLTDMSFRVRLLHVNYTDTRGKIKPYKQYAFFIEDVDAMAKRNKCNEVQKTSFHTERTDRQQMTLVAVFQYMIGNTDWAVPNYHNMKLMRPKKDSVSRPYPVPYDFDFCGLVNASYASPQEELGISSVTERVYRGFKRTPEELQEVLDIFRKKKDNFEKLIKNFEPLGNRHRQDMQKYIDDFYKIIDNKYMVARLFIDEARTN